MSQEPSAGMMLGISQSLPTSVNVRLLYSTQGTSLFKNVCVEHLQDWTRLDLNKISIYTALWLNSNQFIVDPRCTQTSHAERVENIHDLIDFSCFERTHEDLLPLLRPWEAGPWGNTPWIFSSQVHQQSLGVAASLLVTIATPAPIPTRHELEVRICGLTCVEVCCVSYSYWNDTTKEEDVGNGRRKSKRGLHESVREMHRLIYFTGSIFSTSFPEEFPHTFCC